MALSRNSTGGLFYGLFAGFTAIFFAAVLRLRGAAASPDPRKAKRDLDAVVFDPVDVVGLYPSQIRIYH